MNWVLTDIKVNKDEEIKQLQFNKEDDDGHKDEENSDYKWFNWFKYKTLLYNKKNYNTLYFFL